MANYLNIIDKLMPKEKNNEFFKKLNDIRRCVSSVQKNLNIQKKNINIDIII
jgi:predicted nucleotide-binding protein (sugar kinase/HSP70/actin superfamily)